MFKTCKKPPMSIMSVSGNVCSFNSLQEGLPLYSHKIALTATQSGSGTPSPDNVRTINGYSAINIGSDDKYAGFINFNQLLNALATSTTQDGLIITNNNDGSVSISGTAEATGSVYLTDDVTAPRDNSVILFNFIFSSALSDGNYVFFSGFGVKYAMTERGRFFKRNDGTSWRNGFSLHYEQGTTIDTRIWLNIHNLTQMFGSTKADEIYNMEQQTAGSGVAYFRSLFPNDYYDYNAGTLTTVSAVNGSTNSFFNIQIGSTVYGGEYDARTGVLTVTSVKEVLRGSYFSSYSASIQCAVGGKPVGWLPWLKQTGGSCEMLSHGLPTTRSDIGNVSNGCFIGDVTGGNQEVMFIKFAGYSSLEDIQALIEAQYNSNTPVEVVYKLDTPITIQLPPCPIDTLEGVNNIFADCGSTALEAIKIGR